jgi:uncharacterized protein YeaO (DUF488 family)
MTKIYTGKIGRYKGDDGLDITIMTGEIAFAPSWDLVRRAKKNKISREEYKKEYLRLMRESFIKNREIWDWVLNQNEITFLCYCPSGKFCHRILLAYIFEKLGAEYMGER